MELPLLQSPEPLESRRRNQDTQDLEPAPVHEFESFENPTDLLEGLEYEDTLPEACQPSALKTQLYPHEKQALTFMSRREQGWNFRGAQDDLWRVEHCHRNGLVYMNTVTGELQPEPPPDFRGGIIADQMGLGKSLSIIALIAQDRDQPDYYYESSSEVHVRSTLIVVRAPLLHTWHHQLQTHLNPGTLSWLIHHGKQRLRSIMELESTDIVVTTYQTLVAEFRKHAAESQVAYSVKWRRIVLDEAHDIRDHNRLTATAMRHLEASSRWALTGTPIQNNLSDVASLYQFLRIEPYTDTRIFKEHIRALCNQRKGDSVAEIKQLVRCIMLPRSITAVTLPERHDLICRLEFSPEEATVYNRAKSRTLNLLDNAINGNEKVVSQLNVLPWINSLRMICNLGVRAKTPQTSLNGDRWDLRAAQEMFNGLITAGAAACQMCSLDLGSVATEVADQVSDTSTQPQLSSCSYLICRPCLEKSADGAPRCCHYPSHQMLPVSTLSSSLSMRTTTFQRITRYRLK